MTGCSEPRILRIELPPDLPLLSLNDRLHHMERANRTKKIRAEAYKAVKAQPFMPFGQVRLRFILHAADNRKRDWVAGNWLPTIKAIIDGGLVDAGVIKDDADKYLREMSIVRGDNRTDKKSSITVQVIEVIKDD